MLFILFYTLIVLYLYAKYSQIYGLVYNYAKVITPNMQAVDVHASLFIVMYISYRYAYQTYYYVNMFKSDIHVLLELFVNHAPILFTIMNCNIDTQIMIYNDGFNQNFYSGFVKVKVTNSQHH